MKKPDELRPHDTVRSQLRIPAGLHERLTVVSNASGRSMNAEIVARLERSFSVNSEDAVQLLMKAMQRIPEWKKHRDELEAEIASFESGEGAALGWLRHANANLTDADLLQGAKSVLKLLDRDLSELQAQVPALIEATRSGSEAPITAQRLLADS